MILPAFIGIKGNKPNQYAKTIPAASFNEQNRTIRLFYE